MVPICRKDGKTVLFVHVPKCGGTTIEGVFRNSGYRIHYLDGRMGPKSLNYFRRCTPQHMHGELLQTLFRLERFDAIFLLVRDPLARFRSEYGMRNKTADPSNSAAIERWTDKTLRRYLSDPYIYDNHIRPQSQFLVPGARVFKLEDGMKKVIQQLNSTLALDLVEELPNLRSREAESGFSSSDVRLASSTADRVRDFYIQDYRLFGYPMPTLASGTRAGHPNDEIAVH